MYVFVAVGVFVQETKRKELVLLVSVAKELF